MAKPKSRVQSAAIAGMLGVPSPAGEGEGGERRGEHTEGAHPTRDGSCGAGAMCGHSRRTIDSRSW